MLEVVTAEVLRGLLLGVPCMPEQSQNTSVPLLASFPRLTHLDRWTQHCQRNEGVKTSITEIAKKVDN